MVGRISTVSGENSIFENQNIADFHNLTALQIDYQPAVIPGDNSQNQRYHGELMWAQFANFKSIGIQSVYVTMFDEYNEGNQIAKTAENSTMVPLNTSTSLFPPLNVDGVYCSSDYYLRLTGAGGTMLKTGGYTKQRYTAPQTFLMGGTQTNNTCNICESILNQTYANISHTAYNSTSENSLDTIILNECNTITNSTNKAICQNMVDVYVNLIYYVRKKFKNDHIWKLFRI